MPINVVNSENLKLPLLDALGKVDNHIYLIGEGGIGKTTALLHLMNSAYVNTQYTENAQIPIFVELSFAPDTYGKLYEGNKSSFIRRAIFKQLRDDRTVKQVSFKEINDIDEVFSIPYEIAVRPITDILCQTTPAPEYLLLLDGLNEVSTVMIEETGQTVAQLVMQEIDWLIENCPNVKIVLTSRSDETEISSDKITRLHLSGIENSEIKSYLKNAGFCEDDIENLTNDKDLCNSLQTPLFLTMFASLSKTNNISTQGEILRTFFNEKTQGVYTQQNHYKVIEKNTIKSTSAYQKKRITAIMLDFILDFILPEIAWHMERKQNFYLPVRNIKTIIEPIFFDTNDTSVCGDFGQILFDKYRNGSSTQHHTYSVAKDLWNHLGSEAKEVCEKIIDTCVLSLGIMQETAGKYGFVHQHIRDYFAAVKNINTLRLSRYIFDEEEKDLAFDCMCSTFKDEPVSCTVRKFMGEYLSEHKNRPYYKNGKWIYGVPSDRCERTLIEDTLYIYKNIFDKDPGYAIYSLLKILQESRGALAGLDLSYLDLTKCNLNASGLGLLGLSANLYCAKLNPNNVFSSGHKECIKHLSFSTDGTKLISCDKENIIKIWETKTGICIGKFMPTGYVVDDVLGAYFFNQNKQIFSFFLHKSDHETTKGFICVWDIENNTPLNFVKVCNCDLYKIKFKFSPENQLFLIYDYKHIKVISLSDLSTVYEFESVGSEGIVDVTFIGKTSQLAVVFDNQIDNHRFKTLKRIDIKTGQSISTLADDAAFELCDTQENNIVVLFQSGNDIICQVRDASSLQTTNEFVCCSLDEIDSYFKNTLSANLISLDNQSLLVCCYLNTLSVFSLKSNNLILKRKLIERVWFDPYLFNGWNIVQDLSYGHINSNKTGTTIAVGGYQGDLSLYETRKFSLISHIPSLVTEIESYFFTPDSNYIVAFSSDKKIRIFDAKTLMLVSQSSSLDNKANALNSNFKSDESFITINNELMTVPALQTVAQGSFIPLENTDNYYVLDKNTIYDLRKLQTTINLEDMRIQSFSNNAVIALCDKAIAVVDVNTGKTITTLSIKNEDIVAVTANQDLIAACSSDDTLCVWDAKNYSLLNTKKKDHYVSDLKFSKDGNYLLCLSGNCTYAYNAHSLCPEFELDGALLDATSNYIAFTPDYKQHYLYNINTRTVSPIPFPHSYKSEPNCIKISPDEKKLLIKDTLCTLVEYDIIEDANAESGIRFERSGEIKSIYGLDVLGVNFNNVSHNNDFTFSEKELLKQYGAIID